MVAPRRASRWRVSISPLEAGLALGAGAAAVQGFYQVLPPVAYGVCFAGHSRDLLNWLANAAAGVGWTVSPASLTYPLLTVIGTIAGASIAAWQHGELKFKPARHKARNFALGFITINLALVIGACPVRSVLLGAYGDLYGVAVTIFIGLGVVLATWATRRRARATAESRVER